MLPFPLFKLLKVLEKAHAARIISLRAVRLQKRVQRRNAQVRVRTLAIVAPEDHVAHAFGKPVLIFLLLQLRLQLRMCAGRGSRATRRTTRSYPLVARERRRGDDDASERRELRDRDIKGLDECFDENAGSTCFTGDRFLQKCSPRLGLGSVRNVIRSSVK